MSLSNIKVNNSTVVGVDNEPTAGSENLVKSGGTFEFLQNLISSLKANVGYWYHASNGRKIYSTEYSGTELTKVYPGRTYLIVGNITSKVAHVFFDANKDFVSSSYSGDLKITIPQDSGIEYIALDFNYSADYISVGFIDVTEIENKNIPQLEQIVSSIASSVGFTKNSVYKTTTFAEGTWESLSEQDRYYNLGYPSTIDIVQKLCKHKVDISFTANNATLEIYFNITGGAEKKVLICSNYTGDINTSKILDATTYNLNTDFIGSGFHLISGSITNVSFKDSLDYESGISDFIWYLITEFKNTIANAINPINQRLNNLVIDTDNLGLFTIKQLKTADDTPGWYNIFQGLNLNAFNIDNQYWGSVAYRVTPGATYKLLTDMSRYPQTIAFWDSEKAIMSNAYITTSLLDAHNGIFTIPEGAYYMVFTFQSTLPWSYAALVGYQDMKEVLFDISTIKTLLEVENVDKLFVNSKHYDSVDTLYNNTMTGANSIVVDKKYKFHITGTFTNADINIYFIKNGGPNAFTRIKSGFTGDLDIEYELSTGTSGCDGLGFKLDAGSGSNVDFEVTYKEDVSKRLDRIEANLPSSTKIYCFGDSITLSVRATDQAHYYPALLNALLTDAGKDAVVYNCGVSGAVMANIGGRQGGIPIILTSDISFAAGEISKDITDETLFKSSYQNRNSGLINPSGYPHISPCYIDGHKCTISITRTNDVTTLHLTLADVTVADNKAVTLHAGSQMRFIGGAESQNSIVIIMGGTNGSYSDAEDYVKQCKLMVDSVASGKYLILSQFDSHFTYDGTYATYAVAMSSALNKLKAIEDACLAEFGNKFVNMRQQLVNNGLRYAIEGGYLTDTALLSANNIDAIEKGYCPFGDNRDPSVGQQVYNNGLLWDVHPNNAGCYAMARIVYDALVGLGYV